MSRWSPGCRLKATKRGVSPVNPRGYLNND